MTSSNEKAQENQAKNMPIPDPSDEFPINCLTYCKLKQSNHLYKKIFIKAMKSESRNKKFYIKEWDSKFQEFFNRKV